MKCNGELYYVSTIDASIDENGEPVPSYEKWSEPIPCGIETISENYLAKYEDGELHNSSFSILIEGNHFVNSRVKLTRYGVSLGEFRIISCTPLPLVNRTKIIV